MRYSAIHDGHSQAGREDLDAPDTGGSGAGHPGDGAPLVHGFDPENIILFGSHARGDAGPDSDVDLLIVMETGSKRDAAIRIGVALNAMGVPKDIIVVTPDEFERRKDIVGTVAYPAHHEGRILYERRQP